MPKNLLPYDDVVAADLRSNPGFRRVLLSEAVATMVGGDLQTGKFVLRQYVNATIGFPKLGVAVNKSPKSLMRMLSRAGNPSARSLFDIVAYLQKVEGTTLEVHASEIAA